MSINEDIVWLEKHVEVATTNPFKTATAEAARHHGGCDPTAKLVLKRFDAILKKLRDGPLLEIITQEKRAALGIEPPANYRNFIEEKFGKLTALWMKLDKALFARDPVDVGLWTERPNWTLLRQNFEQILTKLLQWSLQPQWTCGYDIKGAPVKQPPLVFRQEAGNDISLEIRLTALTTALTKHLQLKLKDSKVSLRMIRSTGGNKTELPDDVATNLYFDEEFEPAKKSVQSYVESAGVLSCGEKRNRQIANTLVVSPAIEREWEATAQATARFDQLQVNRITQMPTATKYHFHVEWLLKRTNGGDIKIATISLPVTIPINKSQESDAYEAIFWDILASDAHSVACSSIDHPSVELGHLREALGCHFKKLTGVNPLREDELDHMFSRLQTDAVGNISRKQVSHRFQMFAIVEGVLRTDQKAPFSLWQWYFEAATLIIDRGNQISKPTPKGQLRKGDPKPLTMSDMAEKGILRGFMSRAGTKAELQQFRDPMMLIRMSDSQPGDCTVSYTTPEGDVYHVHPFSRDLLVGLAFPTVMYMLVQVKHVEHIYAGYTVDPTTGLWRHRVELRKDILPEEVVKLWARQKNPNYWKKAVLDVNGSRPADGGRYDGPFPRLDGSQLTFRNNADAELAKRLFEYNDDINFRNCVAAYEQQRQHAEVYVYNNQPPTPNWVRPPKPCDWPAMAEQPVTFRPSCAQMRPSEMTSVTGANMQPASGSTSQTSDNNRHSNESVEVDLEQMLQPSTSQRQAWEQQPNRDDNRISVFLSELKDASMPPEHEQDDGFTDLGFF